MRMRTPLPGRIFRQGMIGLSTYRIRRFLGDRACGDAPEYGAEVRNQPIRDLFPSDRPPEEPLERGDAPVGKTARDDEVEAIEIRADVEGKPVARDPTREAHPDGRQLLGPHPGTGQTGDALGRNPVVCGRPNEDFFEVAHVAVDVAAIGFEIENGIAHDLAGTVVGDVAAPAGFVDVDTPRRQLIEAGENVAAPAIAAHAERQHVWVLEKQQHVVDAVVLALIDEGTLKRQPLAVRHDAESADFEPSCHLRG
jgi:hypothetical protein